MPKKSKDASSDVPPADLYWAARHGSELRIRAALDKGAAVDALFDGRPALVVAALSDQPHAVAALLEAGASVDLAEDGTSLTPLASAVIEGSLKCAERLADAGADLERADADGLTPLMQSRHLRAAFFLICDFEYADGGCTRPQEEHVSASAISLGRCSVLLPPPRFRLVGFAHAHEQG